MGKGRQGTVVQRITAVAAGGLLVSMAFAGPAFADTTTPTTTTPTTTTPTTTTPTTTTPKPTSTSSAPTVSPDGLLPGDVPDPAPPVGGNDPLGSSALPSFPGFPAFGGLPAFPSTTNPTAACAEVASQLFALDPTQQSAALKSPAAIFCGFLGLLPSGLTPTTTGGGTETVFAAPQVFGANATTTSRTPTTAFATQVASVPRGGVNTGDGSFGE